MNPVLLILMVFIMPTVFFAVMFGPLYLGMCGSLYFFYHMQDIQAYLYRPNFVLGMQQSLYQYWVKNSAALSFTDFIIPVWGPVLLGLLLSIYMTKRFIDYLKNIFRVV
jgi:hypothetical protein